MDGNYKNDKYISPFTFWKGKATGKDCQLIQFDNEKGEGKIKYLDSGHVCNITKSDLFKTYHQITK